MTEPLAQPGELSNRPGTYRTFIAGMLERARLDPRLARLNTEARHDFTVMLLSAWARVLNVLGFYQERIVNEGYLPTAVEPVSILHLAEQIGVRRKPALGAETSLALQLISGGAGGTVTVEPGPGLSVQNAPHSPNELPVVFESGERRRLRVAWNALRPVVPSHAVPAALWTGCRSLRLAGTATGVRAGHALLLGAAEHGSWLVIADNVEVDRALGCTAVTWRTPLPPVGAEDPVALAQVTLFERSQGLFGRAAMQWQDVPDKQKQAIGVRPGGMLALDELGPGADPPLGPPLWRTWGDGTPPPGNVHALLGNGRGALLAGSDRGLFRSTGGDGWEALALPPGRHDICSLHRDKEGFVYAGSASGLTFVSNDGGEIWSALPQSVTHVSEASGLLRFLSRRKVMVSGESWTLESPIRALAGDARSGDPLREIYAGTDQGVFALPRGAAGWQPFHNKFHLGAADFAVRALAVADRKQLWAATDRGVYVSPLGEAKWAGVSSLPVKDCTSLAVCGDEVFVGTPAGVYKVWADRKWREFNPQVLRGPWSISSLAVHGGELYAATEAGVLVTVTDEPRWRSLDVEDLALFEMDPLLAAGLDEGIVSTPLRQRFERFGIVPQGDVEVRRLTGPASSGARPIGWQLREGAPLRRIFRIYLGPRLRVTLLVRNRTGACDLLAGADGVLLLSLPPGPVVNEQWPDFAVDTGEARILLPVRGARLFLDGKVKGIEPGSALVLAPCDSLLVTAPEVHTVKASETVPHKAFGRQATTTQIIVDPTARLLAADLRTTSAYLASRPLTPFVATEPVLPLLDGCEILLSGVHSDLERGRSLAVSGPRPAAAIVPSSPSTESPVVRAAGEAWPALDQQMIAPGLSAAFAAAGLSLSPSAAVSVVRRGGLWLVRDGDKAWRIERSPDVGDPLPLGISPWTLYEVLGRSGKSWLLQSGDETVEVENPVWQQARTGQSAVSEIATIASTSADPVAGVTRIELEVPLANLYDAALCRICANVVRVTQGESVASEILGSGQPANAPQSFTLHRAPVTSTRGSPGGAIRRELLIRVNGANDSALVPRPGADPELRAELWWEIRSLAFAGPSDRVYSVSTDAAGRATVRFGDGGKGARLPAGADNVRANYRHGAGLSGNVPAGALIALRKRPAGIRSAVNPVSATGGVDAEPIDALRARAPRKFGCCDRIVTLVDYEYCARDFPGIGHAQAHEIRRGGTLAGIWLTLATDGGLPISKAPRLRRALERSIKAKRADRLPLRLDDPLLVWFEIELSIEVVEGHEAAAVKRRVEAALADAFGFARRGFGQAVEGDEVLAAVRPVEGVQTVVLTSLCRCDAPEADALRLPARPALEYASGAMLPAEWLLLKVPGGVRIKCQALR